MKFRNSLTVWLASFVQITTVSAADTHPSSIPEFTAARAAVLTEKINDFVATKGINTVGVAVIKGGKTVWTGSFGTKRRGCLPQKVPSLMWPP